MNFISFLFSKKKTVKITIIFLVLISSTIVIIWPLSFQSKSIISVENSGGSQFSSALSDLSGLSSLTGIGLLGDKMAYGKIEAIFESEKLRKRVVDRFDLKKHYNNESDTIYYYTLKELDSNLDLLVMKGGTIEITVIDKNRLVAKEINQFIIGYIDSVLLTMEKSKSKLFISLLDQKNSVLMDSLANIERRISLFQLNNKIFDPGIQFKFSFEIVNTLQIQSNLLKNELDIIKYSIGDDNQMYRAKKMQLDLIERQIKEYTSIQKADWFKGSNFDRFPALMQIFTELKRQQVIYNKFVEVLLPLYERMKLDEVSKIRSISVIDPPTSPEIKYKPKRIVFFLGIFIPLNILLLGILYLIYLVREKNNLQSIKLFIDFLK